MYLRSFILFSLMLISDVPASYSASRNQARITVEDINVQIFDRAINKVVLFSRLPNPYGLNMDLLISVKVKGDPNTTPQNLTLSIDAKGYTTAATGDVEPWKQNLTKPVLIVSDNGVSYIPFIVEYSCYPKVTLTARLPNSSKSKNISLPCAE